MAERIVSPGVFTNEVDQSFLAGGVAQIGASIVGPTVKGPALIPTQITSFSQFQEIFGPVTDESYVPFVVQDYLSAAKGGNVITVTRLLYEDGYKLTNGALAVIAKSGSGAGAVQVVTHVLHPTNPVTYNAATNLFDKSVLLDAGSGSFAIKVSGSFATDLTVPGFSAFLAGDGVTVSGSIVQTDNKYLSKVFGTSPKSLDYPVYVQYENYNASSVFANLGNVTTELAILSNYEFLQDYNTAATPWITTQKIGSNVKILSFSYIEKTKIGNNVTIGPFARLRPDTVLEDNSKIGNFVEIKKSRVGKNSKVNHLSYIGDSVLGKNVNVGAGTITCNYDGKNKYKTKILDNAFIGSNSSLVAPVKIGKNTVIGAGSIITKDVKDNALALSRVSQREYKKRKK